MKMKSLLLVALASLGLTSTTMAQNFPNYIPANGLVGWWPFNGNAIDESGNGNDGTIIGASLSTDRFGIPSKAFSFDGVDDFIWAGLLNNLNGASAASISYWIKTPLNYPTNPAGNYGTVIGHWINNSQFNGPVGIQITNVSDGSFNISLIDGQGTSSAPNLVNQNEWSYVTVVFNGSNIQNERISLFLNGVFNQYVSVLNAPSTLGVAATRTYFGAACGPDGNDDAWSYFNGQIDDIGIWTRALNQQEITNLYNALSCNNVTTINPQTNSLTTGSTATFTATSTDPNVSYVWQSNLGQGFQTLYDFENYSGTNTSILSIANVQLPNHTLPLRVITTSGECVDTSDIATISILDTCITSINDTTFITVTDTLVINTLITGINPPNNSNTIKVYPNPSNSHITIDYGNFEIMNGYQLKIQNSLGQQVFQTNISQQTDYLTLSNWGGNGIYFAHIIDSQGNTIDIRKIVLQ